MMSEMQRPDIERLEKLGDWYLRREMKWKYYGDGSDQIGSLNSDGVSQGWVADVSREEVGRYIVALHNSLPDLLAYVRWLEAERTLTNDALTLLGDEAVKDRDALKTAQARIAELEAEKERLREQIRTERRASLAWLDKQVSESERLRKRVDEIGAMLAAQMPAAAPTAPASASDAMRVDAGKREARSAPQNGTDAPPGTAWDAGGNLRAVDDGGWMDEED